MLGLLIGCVILAPLYAWRVGHVVRVSQNLASGFAMAVFIFSVGGWFGTTTWYQPWFGAIAVPLAVIILTIVNLPKLAVEGPAQQQLGVATPDLGTTDEAAELAAAA